MKTKPTTYGYGLDPELDKKAERLIRNEVLACQSGLVEHLLSKSDDPSYRWIVLRGIGSGWIQADKGTTWESRVPLASEPVAVQLVTREGG